MNSDGVYPVKLVVTSEDELEKSMNRSQKSIDQPFRFIDRPYFLTDQRPKLIDRPQLLINQQDISIDRPRNLMDRSENFTNRPQKSLDHSQNFTDRPNRWQKSIERCQSYILEVPPEPTYPPGTTRPYQDGKSPSDQTDQPWEKVISIDGLDQIVQSKKFIWKIFWIILVLMALTGSAYEVYKIFDHFWNGPPISTYQVRSVGNMAFPDIYLCPTNPVNETHRRLLNADPAWLAMLGVHSRNTEWTHKKRGALWEKIMTKNGLGNWTRWGNITLIKDDIGPILPPAPDVSVELDPPEPLGEATLKNVTLYFMELGYDIEEFMEECKFDQNLIECSNIGRPVLDRNYGKCFLISLRSRDPGWWWRESDQGVPISLRSQIRNQVVPGQGLSLVLNTHSDLVPPENGTIFRGVHISVQDSYQPDGGTKMMVEAGTYTRLNLQRRDFSFLKFKTDCLDEADYPRYLVLNSTSTPYSIDACKFDCLQWQALVHCHCLLLIDFRFLNSSLITDHTRFCTPDHVIRCANHVTTLSIQCSDRCRMPCRWSEYHVTTSSLKLGDPPGLGSLGDYIFLDIAFDQLQEHTMIQAQSVTIDMVIANIGGILALFFGTSLLAIVHSLIMCCAVIKRRCT